MKPPLPSSAAAFPPLGDVSYRPAIVPPDTARRLAQMAEAGGKDVRVAHLARSLVRNLVDENVEPFLAVLSEIQAIHNFTFERLRYTRDPQGVELVYSPQVVAAAIEQGGRFAEDCDTYAAFVAAMLLALGRKTRITIASFVEGNPFHFSHVFAEVWLPASPRFAFPGRWVVVDPSIGGAVRRMCAEIKHAVHFYP